MAQPVPSIAFVPDATMDAACTHADVRVMYPQYFRRREWLREDLVPENGTTYTVVYLPFQDNPGVMHHTNVHDFVRGVAEITGDTNLDNYVKAAGCASRSSGQGHCTNIRWSLPQEYFPIDFVPTCESGKRACVCTHFILHNFYILHVPSKKVICTGGECVRRFLHPDNVPYAFCHRCLRDTKTHPDLNGVIHCEPCRKIVMEEAKPKCPVCHGPIGRARKRCDHLYSFDGTFANKVLCVTCRRPDVVKAKTEMQTCAGCRSDCQRRGKICQFIFPFDVTLAEKTCRLCSGTFRVCPHHEWRDICDKRHAR